MRTVLAIVLFAALFGCGSHEQPASPERKDSNYPLNVGASWTLTSGAYTLVVRVDSLMEVAGKRYARLREVSTELGSADAVTRTLYLAEDTSKNVMRLAARLPSAIGEDPWVSVWYKFDAQLGQSWSAMANNQFDSRSLSQYRITLLSRADTVVTPDTTFTHCYRFSIDDLHQSDSEYSDWICPGIGLVKRLFGSDPAKAFVLTSYSPRH